MPLWCYWTWTWTWWSHVLIRAAYGLYNNKTSKRRRRKQRHTQTVGHPINCDIFRLFDDPFYPVPVASYLIYNKYVDNWGKEENICSYRARARLLSEIFVHFFYDGAPRYENKSERAVVVIWFNTMSNEKLAVGSNRTTVDTSDSILFVVNRRYATLRYKQLQ